MTALAITASSPRHEIEDFVSKTIDLYLAKANNKTKAAMEILAEKSDATYQSIWRYHNKMSVPPATKGNILLAIVRETYSIKTDHEAITYIPKSIQEYYDIVNCERNVWKKSEHKSNILDLNKQFATSESARWIYVMTRAGGYITRELVVEQFGKSGEAMLDFMLSQRVVVKEKDKYTTGTTFASAQTPEAGVHLSRTIIEEVTPQKIHQKRAANGNIVVRLDQDSFIAAKKILVEAYQRIAQLDKELRQSGNPFAVSLNIADIDTQTNEEITQLK